MEKKRKTIRIRTARGHFVAPEQINALAVVARGSKMTECWFGEIAEAVNNNGEKVHVVRNLKIKKWMPIRQAVSCVDGGIESVRDYTNDPAVVDAYYRLLEDVGLEDSKENRLSNWAARRAAKSRAEMTKFMLLIEKEDHFYGRFRPMKIRSHGGAYYLDLGGCGKWSRTLCLWLCSKRGLAYDVCLWGPRMVECTHVVRDGKKCVLVEVCNPIPLFMNAEDIVAGRLPKKGKKNGADGNAKNKKR